jgi:hypothetical protein
MIQVISTDIMIKKQISSEELKLLSITGADDSGTIKLILKNDNIPFAAIGSQLILRNIYVELINDYIILIANENTKIYENPKKPVKSDHLENNYSSIKISSINLDSL